MGYVTEILNESNLDILCVTETWLLGSDINIIRAALPKTHSILHVPRSTTGPPGGGVAVIFSVALSNIRLVHEDSVVPSFEIMEVTINFNHHITRLAVIYRPGHPGTDRNFMDDFSLFLENFSRKSGKLLVCGDFNYWVDSPSMKPYSAEFLEQIDLNNFVNHISRPTHVSGHTLDLVLSPVDSDYISAVDVAPIDPIVSDHALVTFSLVHSRLSSYCKTIIFRNYRSIDQTMIAQEINHSLNTANITALSAEELVSVHNDFFLSIQDRYCPEVVKRVIVRDDFPWYDASVASLRRVRRRAERKWRRLRTEDSRSEYITSRRLVVSRILTRKVEYYRNCVASCGSNQKKVFAVLNSLLGKKTITVLPSSASNAHLASDFATFFESKISRIRNQLDGVSVDEFSVDFGPHFDTTRILSSFHPVRVDGVVKCIRELNKTFCQLDPINVSKIPLAYESAAVFVVEIINHCFEEEYFVSSEKQALLHPLLKGGGLDCENMANYRPVSNLSFLSKIMERAILDQLLPLFEGNGVIPSLQSAYRKCHSTETALCRIHNDLVVNMCAGKLSLLVLLDLSAAFDTIDHQMLLEDLWSFGDRDSALSLLKSYLSNRYHEL